MQTTIGKSVKACRKAMNVSQSELAQQIGKNPASIAALEQDKAYMEVVYTLCDIADYLDVSLDKLVGRKHGEA